MPDCDQFARVIGRHGRLAVESLCTALENGRDIVNLYALARACESLWKSAGGIAGLDSLLSSAAQPELPFGRIPSSVGNSKLDMVAQRAVRRAQILGLVDRHSVALQVARDIVSHHITFAKNGLLDRLGADKVFNRPDIDRLVNPVVSALGASIANNPSTRRVAISSKFNDIPTNGNILDTRLA